MAEKALPLSGCKKFSGSGTFSETEDGLVVTNQIWVFPTDTLGSNFIPVSPSGKTYYYDVTYSNVADNYFLIGIESFDVNKTNTLNNSCRYILTTSAAADHTRKFGTIDISKDGNGNPTSYIRIRILNSWDGANSANTATIHFLSLREVTTLGKTSVYKNGQLTADSFRNTTDGAHIYKNGVVGSTEFYEI